MLQFTSIRHIHCTFYVLLLQAPRLCKWWDVRHLLVDYNIRKCSFDQYAYGLAVTTLSLYNPPDSEDFIDNLMQDVKEEWRASEWESGHNDERQLQPVVHCMLRCAVKAVRTIIPSDREFLVVTEPNIARTQKKQVSDEAVVEVVSECGIIRILLDLKGSKVLPTSFHASSDQFAQVIQQAALAFESGYWKKEILCGICHT